MAEAITVTHQPGSYVPIERTWKTGDKVEVSIPFSLRLESMPDDSNRVAVMYGPLVLAGDLGPVADSASKDPLYVPVMMTEKRDPSVWMKPVEGKPNTYITVNTGRTRDVEMKPFFAFYDRRYSVYWDLFNDRGWTTKREYNGIKGINKRCNRFLNPGMPGINLRGKFVKERVQRCFFSKPDMYFIGKFLKK